MHDSISSKLIALLAILAAFSFALSACGDDDESSGDDLGADPATMAPADVPFYAEAVVRPEGDMLENFNSTISKLTGTEDPGAMITSAIDDELATDDLSYAADVEPWLGARVGGFVTDFDPSTEMAEGAVAVAVTDTEAAQSFIDKARESSDDDLTETSYNEVDYLAGDGAAIGLSGDFMVLGTEQGFKDAVDAGTGDSLAENSDASASLDEVPEDSLFSGYVDTQAAIDLVESSGGLTSEQLKQFEDQVAQYSEGPINFWGVVGADNISLAGSAPAPTDAAGPSELLTTFPADSWLAFASADVGAQLQTTLDQFEQGFQAGLETAAGADVFMAQPPDPLAEIERATGVDLRTDLAAIGDAGGFVEGSSLLGLGGGLVLETSDEQATAELVGKLRTALSRERSLEITKTDAGFDLTISGAPVGAQVVVQDGKLIVAAGGDTVEDVLAPDETLAESDRFNAARDALGEDVTPSFFLDFLPILQLVESSGQATGDPDYEAARPYLEALDFIAAGSKVDGERTTGSFVLGVREPSSSETDSAAATLSP